MQMSNVEAGIGKENLVCEVENETGRIEKWRVEFVGTYVIGFSGTQSLDFIKSP